jgi:hypothetical protein
MSSASYRQRRRHRDGVPVRVLVVAGAITRTTRRTTGTRTRTRVTSGATTKLMGLWKAHEGHVAVVVVRGQANAPHAGVKEALPRQRAASRAAKTRLSHAKGIA